MHECLDACLGTGRLLLVQINRLQLLYLMYENRVISQIMTHCRVFAWTYASCSRVFAAFVPDAGAVLSCRVISAIGEKRKRDTDERALKDEEDKKAAKERYDESGSNNPSL